MAVIYKVEMLLHCHLWKAHC